MARLAFIVGSNGPSGGMQPLKYARRDAEQLAAALATPRCGFTVTVASTTSNPFLLREELFNFAQAAQEDDVVIVYFSGHGIIHSGALVLLLDESVIKRILTTAIPSADFLTALGASRSHNKLLILDCCNAGTVSRTHGLKDGAGTPVEELGIKAENHAILMASGHLESARELDELKGGFLTKNICEGLTTSFREADSDGDGALSLQDMRKWLERRAALHNLDHPDRPVPIPQQYGRGKGEFFLTVPRTWKPFYVDWPDGSVMVALPKMCSSGFVACIGKAPITNRQYKEFVQETGAREPKAGRAFRPWRDRRFSADDQPVVCVSYHDAVEYCRWVDGKKRAKNPVVTKLPTHQLWELAAFGTEWFSWDPAIWRAEPSWPRSGKKAPFAAKIDSPTNKRGMFPMLGNVWEWCAIEWDKYAWDAVPGNLDPWEYPGEIRGGSFLEDLETASDAKLQYDQFAGGINSRDKDTGFRIASEVSVSVLPDDLRECIPEVKVKEAVKKKPATWRRLKKR